MNPDVKCPIHESEIILDLEERIREAEDAVELAALVQAWCQITRKYSPERQVPLDVRMSTAIKEVMISISLFAFGVLTAVGFFMLLARL